MSLKNALVKLILIAQLIMAHPAFVFAGNVHNILIVANSDDEPYLQAIAGYKKQLSKEQNVRFTEVFVKQNQNFNNTLVSELKDNPPMLIYSLGGEATEAVKLNTSTIPIVATMILKKTLNKQASNVTGVYLNYPLITQFEWVKKFFPEQRKVAIFFNTNENGQVIQEATKVAEKNGFEVIPIRVETPKELPNALDQLSNKIEILFAIPDEVAMSSKTAREVLLASFRNRVPLVGLSESWVKSGALYSLTWDYSDLGKQCAFLSDKLLKGVAPASIPFEYPGKIAYSINTKIAEHMKMEISEALIKSAKQIFN
jgi:putative tryptophan/tyrosine transport system substrate-binding protein